MSNEFRIRFEGRARVVAEFRGTEIATDQHPDAGGDGTAPEPFTLFLASLGTCAGINVRRFCETRGISTDGIRLTQRLLGDPSRPGRITRVRIDIHLPPEFPERYREAVVRAADGCAVKKYLHDPFQVEIRALAHDA